jgi:hypothetical protein
MPLERLTRDPSNDAPPDFHAPAYNIITQAMRARNDYSEEEAIEILLASWLQEHQEKRKRTGHKKGRQDPANP